MWIKEIVLRRQVALDVQALHDAPSAAAQEAQGSLVDLAAVVTESDSKQTLRCPECSKPMAKDRYHPMIPVTIDCCRACQSMWLDAGEFNLLRRLYEEMAASDDPKIVRLREKVAAASAGWQMRSTATEEAERSLDQAARSLSDVADAAYMLSSLVRMFVR
jgi:Zn-finger nucleic acid-binding protein